MKSCHLLECDQQELVDLKSTLQIADETELLVL